MQGCNSAGGARKVHMLALQRAGRVCRPALGRLLAFRMVVVRAAEQAGGQGWPKVGLQAGPQPIYKYDFSSATSGNSNDHEHGLVHGAQVVRRPAQPPACCRPAPAAAAPCRVQHAFPPPS